MDRLPPTLDMTPEGTFRSPPPRSPIGPNWSFKILVAAILIAVVSVAIAVAAFALWVVSMMLPVVVIAGAVAWGMSRYRRWQSLRGARHLRPR